MTSVREITPDQLVARLSGPTEQRPLLLDVRWPQEHQYVALPDSILIPLDELEERVSELDRFRGRQLVVYCHHGVRSLTGASICTAHGLDAVSLQGGIHLWACDIDPSMPRY